MSRRVLSVVRNTAGGLRAGEPVLEANAYALAEDLDLSLLLVGNAVELAVAAAEVAPAELAGVSLPPAAAPQDLRALVESGVGVYAEAQALADRGIDPAALAHGVEPIDEERLATLFRAAEAVLNW